MKTITLMLLALFLPAAASADQVYNPFEDRYETVSPSESGENERDLKYNAFEDEWSYERPDAEPEYNAFEDKFEYPD